MKFSFGNFSCDVEIFHKNHDEIVLRLCDIEREQTEDAINNLVVVDPGYGYLCIKIKGDSVLLSGFLDERVFATDAIMEALLDYIEVLQPRIKNTYMPYHLSRFRTTTYVEYNGEY